MDIFYWLANPRLPFLSVWETKRIQGEIIFVLNNDLAQIHCWQNLLHSCWVRVDYNCIKVASA